MSLFEEETCCNCGVRFGVPAGYIGNRRRDKKSFYCPNGHGQSYTESEADILRRDRDRLAQQIAQRDDEIAHQKRQREAAERQAAAARGQVTKLKNRASAGVCPCCNRTFSQLQRHMANKHPDFAADSPNNVVPIKAA